MSPTPPTPKAKPGMSRRAFLTLAGTGVVGAGLFVLFDAGKRYIRANTARFVPSMPTTPSGWLQITPDNRVRLVIAKAEMGQGVLTAFTQIVAEELDVPMDAIDRAYGDTREIPGDPMGTAGSTSVAVMHPVLRNAAAHARLMLLAAAAQKLSLPADQLSVRAGEIIAPNGPTGLTYGQLIGGQQIVVQSTGDPATKPFNAYQVVGQRIARVDIPAKVTGQAAYGYDARLPNMGYGKVLRPPTFGARLRQADVSAAQRAPGVLAVLHTGDFVGVVARTQEAAAAALALITAEWDEPNKDLQQAQIDAQMAPGGWGGELMYESGDVARALNASTPRLEAEYSTPFAAQAALEPQGALAYVRQENGAWLAEIWAASQNPLGLPKLIAEATQLKADQVLIHNQWLGGGFGGKAVVRAPAEAARLSQAAGIPVRVNWDRYEEFAHGYLRPPTRHRFTGALDAQGHVAAWQHEQASGLVLFAYFPKPLQIVMGNDLGATRGMLGPYTFANQRSTAWVRELPVPTASWRGLGLLPNVFATESFLDELAAAAHTDPLDFRLAHLNSDATGTRMRRALEQVAELAQWRTPLPPRTDGWRVGRGLACSVDAQTVVAQIAVVAVNPADGAIRVEHVYCAVDCGLVINPDGVEAQVEGCVMWGVSSALSETLTVRDGQLSAGNFGDYHLLTIRQAPEVHTAIVANPTEGPYGMGEPPIGPVAAAIGNALFAATGIRQRTLPFTPNALQ